MNRKLKLLLILLAAAVLAVSAVAVIKNIGGSFMPGIKIKGESLTAYTYSSGGNMNGNSYSEAVKLCDGEHAVLSFSRADWYCQDPEVSEYLVSSDILKDIERVFRKYNMQRWHKKEFSDAFVCDGETSSYHFDFGEEEVWFSSQIFPLQYGNKLKEIDSVISEYRSSGTKLPGLVLPEITEEEMFERRYPKDGQVRIEVYSYCGDYLAYRILNGTGNEVEVSCAYELFKDGENSIIARNESKYIHDVTVYANSEQQEGFRLQSRLQAGRYVLKLGEYECSFELK